ncbi:MAG: 30S ribosomal protein S18 [Dehalococcoidales bacterium]|jgi:small subunit ribosomal protein S18|nr:30S ribosomal protein S18 [Dehalococcoidales bacterium]MDP6222213.1 30S ribosomal protein S18 [Dehalococcoidales bacterium]MDP7415335.1 30S ribosomal protein S18 [Dehalococcoidales bacterium]
MAVARVTRVRKWGRAKYVPRRKFCSFCKNKIEVIDYKEPAKLRSYVSDRGKIEPRRKSGTCARHQRLLATAVKRARHLALLPYVSAHIRGTEGVGLRD